MAIENVVNHFAKALFVPYVYGAPMYSPSVGASSKQATFAQASRAPSLEQLEYLLRAAPSRRYNKMHVVGSYAHGVHVPSSMLGVIPDHLSHHAAFRDTQTEGFVLQ